MLRINHFTSLESYFTEHGTKHHSFLRQYMISSFKTNFLITETNLISVFFCQKMLFKHCLIIITFYLMPLVQLSFTQLTDVSEIKSLGFPDDGEVTDGFSSDDQLGAFLSVRGEGVGQLKLESPIPELLSVADPLT